jgi:hypothetical protein
MRRVLARGKDVETDPSCKYQRDGKLSRHTHECAQEAARRSCRQDCTGRRSRQGSS